MKKYAELLAKRENRWRLYANEKDMREAENAVLGGYDQHRSELDWFPFDEDDDRPDQCNRYIEWSPGPHAGDRFERAMKVAAYLGPKCWLSVYAATVAWGAEMRSDIPELQHTTLRVDLITAEVHQRIVKAMDILHGVEGMRREEGKL